MISTILNIISVALLIISISWFIKSKKIQLVPLIVFTIAVISDLIYNFHNLSQFISFKALQFYFLDYIALIAMIYTLIRIWRETDMHKFGCELTPKLQKLLVISSSIWALAFMLGLIASIVMLNK